MKPEQTQGGGFAGGVFTGPDAQAPSRLGDLARSLGVAGEQVIGGLRENFSARIENTRKLAVDEAAVFEQTTAGYTSEQLRAEIESEPMAAKFKANPYLLPAINVYRGRRQADDLALQMAKSGVDTGDADAVNEFYKTNAPTLDDPFFARGFNEQNSRLQAQFNQQQLKEALVKAEQDAVEASSTLWFDTWSDTKDINAATAAVKSSVFGKSLSGEQLSEIQVGFARRLAIEGNVEDFDAIVGTKRGDAPSLMDTAQYGGDLAALRERAVGERDERLRGVRNQAFSDLTTRFDNMSEQSLLKSPEYAALANFEQKDGEQSELQRQALAAYRSHREQAAARYAQENLRRELEEQRIMMEKNALSLLASGAGYKITDQTVVNPDTGKSTKVTASSLRAGAINMWRTLALGEDFAGLKGPDALKYRAYTDALVKSGEQDPVFQRTMAGLTSGLSPDGLRSNPEGAVQALTIWKNMGTAARERFVTDRRSRAILEAAESVVRNNPTMSPEAAIINAVAAETSGVRVQKDSKAVSTAAKQVKLLDPFGDRTWFGWGGPKKVNPEKLQVDDYLQEEISWRMLAGVPQDVAIEEAAKSASENFVTVNGGTVRLPAKPLASGVTPSAEEWAKTVDTFLKDRAAAFNVPADELRLVWNDGSTYSLMRAGKDGELPEALDYFGATEIYVGVQSIKTTPAAEPAKPNGVVDAADISAVRARRERLERPADPANPLQFGNMK
jgi:hypothetical protein